METPRLTHTTNINPYVYFLAFTVYNRKHTYNILCGRNSVLTGKWTKSTVDQEYTVPRQYVRKSRLLLSPVGRPTQPQEQRGRGCRGRSLPGRERRSGRAGGDADGIPIRARR